MSDFNEELFTKVCTLEAQLELNNKKLYEAEEKISEIERILRLALEIIIDTNEVANGLSKTTRQD